MLRPAFLRQRAADASFDNSVRICRRFFGIGTGVRMRRTVEGRRAAIKRHIIEVSFR